MDKQPLAELFQDLKRSELEQTVDFDTLMARGTQQRRPAFARPRLVIASALSIILATAGAVFFISQKPEPLYGDIDSIYDITGFLLESDWLIAESNSEAMETGADEPGKANYR